MPLSLKKKQAIWITQPASIPGIMDLWPILIEIIRTNIGVKNPVIAFVINTTTKYKKQ